MDKVKLMLVDDDRDLVTTIKTSLEAKGYTVQSAYSGSEFFTLLEAKKPDLIILDVMMPEMSGWEVLTRLKTVQTTAKIPIILVTAKTQYQDVVQGYTLGADYYITKPFTNAQLLKGISLLLSDGNPRLSKPS